jgi:hypothetical protein
MSRRGSEQAAAPCERVMTPRDTGLPMPLPFTLQGTGRETARGNLRQLVNLNI